MNTYHADLLTDIEAFNETAELSETTFGRLALRDPHFVRDLRNGRRIWPETEAKVRGFMSTYKAESAAA